MKDMDSLLEELKQALEDFDTDRCMALIGKLSNRATEMDPLTLIVTALLEVGQPREALQRIQELEKLGTSAPGYDEELAEILRHRKVEALYLTGAPQSALALTLSLEPADPLEEADREFFIGLCHDHLGDPESADEHFAKANELDPDGNPPIPTISSEEAHELVATVLGELPEKILKEMEEVPIILEDLPELAMIQESAGQISPDTLGLYSGSTVANDSQGGFSPQEGMPTTAVIRIYRRNLERMSRNKKNLVEQVKITLLHEIGHHLGLDEEDVDRLGLA
ncbi:MAG: metallopeptidase family protein [Planctomycetes bacterium]|nr:metallopeptidase family protein [Planctomycetota bacterium]